MDFGLLAKNWPYKVAAIVLSVLLWLSVSADKERTDQQVATTLDFQVTDSAWSLLEAPTQVFTTFQGRSGDILALLNQPQIRKVIATVDDSVMNIALSPSDVLFNRSLAVRATSVTPNQVTVRFERRSEKMVSVRAVTDAEASDGFAIRAYEVSPESVLVQGPASYLRTISELSTRQLEVGSVDHQIDRQLVVALPPGSRGLRVTPTSVLVSVHVDSLRTRRFQVPVVAGGVYAGSSVIDPPSVAVDVTGPARLIDALSPSDVLVTLEIAEPVLTVRSQQLQVRLPADVEANATLLTPRVTVSPGASSS